ncbi:sensor domain-containing diguanylate cyclase [Acinetobacter sp. ANC 5584]
MPHIDAIDSFHIFQLAPIAMWIEDWSGIAQQFAQWRAQGVTDLRHFLQQDLQHIRQCVEKIRILEVNQATLTLFEARDLAHLSAHLPDIFRDEMYNLQIEGLVAVWEGNLQFASEQVNYSISGKRIDIQLRGQILPEAAQDLSRILVTTEDITAYQNARRQEFKNRTLAEARFVYSPVALWVEDFSIVKKKLDHLKYIGIEDLRTFLDVHPEFVRDSIAGIRVLDVNQKTLDLFLAPNKYILLENIDKVLGCPEMLNSFREQLLELWEGNLFHQHEVVNHALDGSERHVLLQFSIFPNYEHDWSMVQLAMTDITARKKAESYLEYLGKHDVLTKLYNRAFFHEELKRLTRQKVFPVSAIYLDLNALKLVNDEFGHDAGDDILRRTGEILQQVITAPYSGSRIGGDEFVLLLPHADQQTAEKLVVTLGELFRLDNQYYASLPMSVAIGTATSEPNETLDDMMKRADHQMYLDKNRYYAKISALQNV